MDDRSISVLVLGEDEHAGGQPFRELLDAAEATQSQVHSAGAVDEVEREVRGGRFDAILVDVGDDGDGFVALERVRELSPRTPVIAVITAEEQGIQVLSRGAQDSILRDVVDVPMLLRTIRYAIQRQSVRWAEDGAIGEIRSLEDLSRSRSEVTAGNYAAQSLAGSAPMVFEDLVARYAEALDRAVEQDAYRDAPGASEPLRALGSYLGLLRAHPRDVVQIHVRAIRDRTDGQPPARAQTFVNSGRVALVELMGFLTAYYRNYAWGTLPQIPRRGDREP